MNHCPQGWNKDVLCRMWVCGCFLWQIMLTLINHFYRLFSYTFSICRWHRDIIVSLQAVWARTNVRCNVEPHPTQGLAVWCTQTAKKPDTLIDLCTNTNTNRISLCHFLSTHTNTLDTCVYITVSLCGPLPCNISLIGLVELWCMCAHTHALMLADEDQITHTHSFATPILFSHGTQLHFQGQGWREEGISDFCCSVQSISFCWRACSTCWWFFGLNYRCLMLGVVTPYSHSFFISYLETWKY